MKEELIKNISKQVGNKFNINKISDNTRPDLILREKLYDEEIFDIFILEPDDIVLDKLMDWKFFLRDIPRNHYIILPENRANETRKYIDLISENIRLATYNNKNEVEF